MSDDKTVTKEVEQFLSRMLDASASIASDSDAMRKDLESIANVLAPVIKNAGIRFGDSETWQSIHNYTDYTCRIGIRKRRHSTWVFGVEKSTGVKWNGIVGWQDLFCESAYSTENGITTMYAFHNISREDVAEVIRRLPGFLERYLDELSSRSIEYADLRKRVEAISSIFVDADGV